MSETIHTNTELPDEYAAQDPAVSGDQKRLRDRAFAAIGWTTELGVETTASVGKNALWAIGRLGRGVVDGISDLVNGARKKPSPRSS